ncbi:MAG: GlsB/YeaQ/YmgE family stress response membrane protein [Acidobacteria bacterium]|nr:GlsB/YeaQ/YmgE family stress response membrane protein [Acidobacteriota bacterium]
MSIILWIVFGLVIGVIAKLLMPGKDPGGFFITILLGIAGSFLGGFIGQAIGLYERGEAGGWFMSIIGAVLLLVIYRAIVRRKTV